MIDYDLVSIVIPAYNVEDYILTTIDSVISQTYQNWELLIVDDASTDKTSELVESKARNDKRIRLLRQTENTGAAVARNVGIREAEGRYIAFLDADDWWYPSKLETQIRFMREHNCQFTFTAFEYADRSLNVTGVSHKPSKISYWGILAGNNIGTPGVVWDVAAVGKQYMPIMRMSEDWAMWILLIKKVGCAYAINTPLWKYRADRNFRITRKMSFLKYNYRVYLETVGASPILAVLLLIFLFIPNHILKRLYNSIDSYWYLRKISR